jgi:hypothetical protein
MSGLLLWQQRPHLEQMAPLPLGKLLLLMCKGDYSGEEWLVSIFCFFHQGIGASRLAPFLFLGV